MIGNTIRSTEEVDRYWQEEECRGQGSPPQESVVAERPEGYQLQSFLPIGVWGLDPRQGFQN